MLRVGFQLPGPKIPGAAKRACGRSPGVFVGLAMRASRNTGLEKSRLSLLRDRETQFRRALENSGCLDGLFITGICAPRGQFS